MVVGLAIVLAVVYGVYWLLKKRYAAARAEAASPTAAWRSSPRRRSPPTAPCISLRAGDELFLVGSSEQSVTGLAAWGPEEARAPRGRARRAAAAAAAADPAGRHARGAAEAHGALLTFVPGTLFAQSDQLIQQGSSSVPMQLLVLMTLLAVLPGILLAVTGFTRILIVLGFVRNALGTPTMPPNQMLVGIAFFLTLFVMAPTMNKVKTIAVKPYMAHKIDEQTGDRARPRAAARRSCSSRRATPTSRCSSSSTAASGRRPAPTCRRVVLIPAFIISELKTAFQIGFLIFLPFLIIDMVVSSTLMSMGMMMLPPALISLPFKILLFVLVDGWHLVVQCLVNSFNT